MRDKSTAIITYVAIFLSASLLGFNANAKGADKVINVKVLSIKGCTATPPTIDLIKSVAKELNIKIKLTHIVIKNSEQAKMEHFRGSPTVQINGQDIGQKPKGKQFFGVT